MGVQHEYLLRKNYYETRKVARGRRVKTCDHCGGTIEVGQPSDMHHFYPEFEAEATHPECSEAFLASLRGASNDKE